MSFDQNNSRVWRETIFRGLFANFESVILKLNKFELLLTLTIV